MRSSIALAALALALGWAAPSGAQMMCGPGQTGSTTSAQSSDGMMCGMMRPAQAQPPTTGQQAQPQQRQGMCACCQQMAMMQGGRPGTGGPGSMEQMMREHFPQQQPAPPQQRTPGTPEAPKQP